ncbi:hypothetical protein IGS60_27670 [Janthinobacterium sp. FW305-128]|nr:hypothetical protein [Janthinobacterium sp. FW305-128]
MKKTQLPSKGEIIPTSPESAPKLRATFTDEFKRYAVASPAGSGPPFVHDLSLGRCDLQQVALY